MQDPGTKSNGLHRLFSMGYTTRVTESPRLLRRKCDRSVIFHVQPLPLTWEQCWTPIGPLRKIVSSRTWLLYLSGLVGRRPSLLGWRPSAIVISFGLFVGSTTVAEYFEPSKFALHCEGLRGHFHQITDTSPQSV